MCEIGYCINAFLNCDYYKEVFNTEIILKRLFKKYLGIMITRKRI